MEFSHIPVLLKEVAASLNLREGAVVVDATIGGAGHSKEIIKYKPSVLIGFDRDSEALAAADKNLPALKGTDIRLIKCNFCDIEDNLNALGIGKVDAVLADFGVSSYQIDNYERGFSYMHDAPLDMRMDTDNEITAYDIVNYTPEKKLADIIYKYGGERFSRSIAAAIAVNRPIERTGQLCNIIKSAVPAGYGKTGGHPAKRTFQAIRIAVNDELTSIAKFLEGAVNSLKPGGRIAVITFHSGEDRIVKQYFKKCAADCICPPKTPQCICNHKRTLNLLTKKPIEATIEEAKANPRSMSAKLRVAEKAGE
jgi:16S rRNA (cytosine1402-N4)-methyltransferase